MEGPEGPQAGETSGLLAEGWRVRRHVLQVRFLDRRIAGPHWPRQRGPSAGPAWPSAVAWRRDDGRRRITCLSCLDNATKSS